MRTSLVLYETLLSWGICAVVLLSFRAFEDSFDVQTPGVRVGAHLSRVIRDSFILGGGAAVFFSFGFLWFSYSFLIVFLKFSSFLTVFL